MERSGNETERLKRLKQKDIVADGYERPGRRKQG